MAAERVLSNMYVDNLLDSVETLEEAKELYRQLAAVMSNSGFRLRKWASSSRELLGEIPAKERADPQVDLVRDPLGKERTLGLLWDCDADAFHFDWSPSTCLVFTKRQMLSTAARVFDPLGFIIPATISARTLLQELWKIKCDWDEVPTEDIMARWKAWLVSMESVRSLSVPRLIRLPSESCSFHLFCDASETAYGAVLYCRSEGSAGTPHVSLVIARAKVASLRRLTIPRLELQGAVLGARLASSVSRELQLDSSIITFWTDSMVVLRWLKATGRRFCAFVENRVTEILDIATSTQWRYVPSKENPAVLLIRGVEPEKLAQSLWFRGPSFLWRNDTFWPENFVDLENLPMEGLELVKSSRRTRLQHEGSAGEEVRCLIQRVSQLRRLLRIVARVRRAIARFRSPTNGGVGGPISGKELCDAWEVCVRSVQSHCFITEMTCLKQNRSLPPNSRLKMLDPFIDATGVIRVGGRLHLSHLPLPIRHPPVLPSKHPLSRMLVEEVHADHTRSGVEDTLAEVRARVWIIDSRALVRHVLAKCVVCRRQIGKPPRAPFAWLPAYRVKQPLHVFAHTGLDFFGPFFISVRRATVKRWVCLFTCLAVRAVHLEVCHSLDVDSFLSAFRRFTARRGMPALCVSDNGTNFKAGDRSLREGVKKLNNSQVEESMARKNVEWHFNPPGAPHFGGSWERLIGCAKRAMATVLKGRAVQEEVFQTVVVEVEGLLNGRPLTHVSSHTKDAEPLTPNHFFLGRPYASIPATILEEDRAISRRRWVESQLLVDQFWRRWMREYLPFLASSRRSQPVRDPLQEDDIVLVVDVNNPRGIWPLGRVIKTHPGPDGVVRVVDVQSQRGIMTRLITRLTKLTSSAPVDSATGGEDVVA